MAAAPQHPSQAEASSALAEREKVRQLLAAAQADNQPQLARAAEALQPCDLDRVRDANGMTAVHFAAKDGRLANLEYLLNQAAATSDVRSDTGRPAQVEALLLAHASP